MYNTKNEPCCKLQTLGDNDGQCRFMDVNKYSTLVGHADSRGGCACVGAQNMWEISVPNVQFCCERKIALKKKVYFKNIIQGSIDLCIKGRKYLRNSEKGELPVGLTGKTSDLSYNPKNE